MPYEIYKNTEWKTVEINEKMVEIPVEWEVKNIGESIKYFHGSATPKKENENYQGNLPWILIANMKEKYITEYSGKIKLNKGIKVFPKGTLIGSSSFTVGKFAFLTEDSVVSNHILGVFKRENIYDLDYLYYVLPDLFKLKAQIGGLGTLSITSKRINSLDYISPSIEEQKLIAHYLMKHENMIINLKSLITKEEKQLEFLKTNFLSGKYLIKKI